MKRLEFLPEVEDEVLDAFRHYQREQKGLGQEFRAELKTTLDRIRRMPSIVAPIHADVRFAKTNRFPYVIYYRDLKEVILVIAVLHSSRDPQAWMVRI